MRDLAAIRRDYSRAKLEIQDTSADPLEQFDRWLLDARQAESLEPTAMTLATVDSAGRPDARVVLLKDFGPGGFTFFTDYRSHKAEQLADNPSAALCFWWGELERQVRIAGRCEKLSGEVNDAYFRTRPRESQISAWTSVQSSEVADRQALEAAWQESNHRFGDSEVPRPSHWGGYRLIADEYEFWQGRPGRFHDRIQYRQTAEGAWRRVRLSP